MKRIPILTTLLFGLLALAACQKTNDAAPDGMVEIFAESMNGNGKVVFDGLSATWRSGDAIRINGSTATVDRRGDHAYISNASISEGTNRALYPASLEVVNWGTDNPVVTLPAYYHYRTDSSGHQLLDLPMAAYSNGSTSPLQFKHLTGALYVTVKNTSANARALQSVTVKSNKYALNGSLNVALNTTDLVAARTGTPDELFVTLVFDKVVTLANGESVRVMIPVRPVGSDNNFTIEVKSYASGQSISYLSSKTQPSGTDHSLARNELGYAPMDISDGETEVPVLTLNVDKYEIYTPYDFKLMTDAIEGNWFRNNGAKYYIMNDLDMTGTEVTPIDNIDFIGTIEGNNHTISNLTINGIRVSGSVYCGLFLKTGFRMTFQNITFDNLSLINENVGDSTLYVGAIEACNPNSSNYTKTFSNCTINIVRFNDGCATGTVFFGGLIGCLNDAAPVNISRCHVTTPAINLRCTTTRLGGMIGQNNGAKQTRIENSSWTGAGTTTIKSSYVYAGGLIGQKGLGRFNAENCTVTGRMEVDSSTYHYIGSLIGHLNASAPYDVDGGNNTTGFSASLNGDEIIPVKNIGNR